MLSRGKVKRTSRHSKESVRSSSAASILQEGSPVMAPRFIQLADVAEVLNISSSQAYALVRSGELPAIKIGGRGQWRVESEQLEEYIQRMYSETRTFVEAHPLGQNPEGDEKA